MNGQKLVDMPEIESILESHPASLLKLSNWHPQFSDNDIKIGDGNCYTGFA